MSLAYLIAVFDLASFPAPHLGGYFTYIFIVFSPKVIPNIFVGFYSSLSFQQNWFHPVWSSDAKVIAFLVSGISLTGSSGFPPEVPLGHLCRRKFRWKFRVFFRSRSVTFCFGCAILRNFSQNFHRKFRSHRKFRPVTRSSAQAESSG